MLLYNMKLKGKKEGVGKEEEGKESISITENERTRSLFYKKLVFKYFQRGKGYRKHEV